MTLQRGTHRQRHVTGFTLIELVMATALLTVLMVGVIGAIFGISTTYYENQSQAFLLLRAQHAMDRITEMAGRAVTDDGEYAIFKETGSGAHGIQFRLIASMTDGTITYDDESVVFIYGPDAGDNPNAGIVIGRGPNLSTVFKLGCGHDNILGTTDDDTRARNTESVAAVELLIPSEFAPRRGEMFNVDISTSARLLTFTLRLNVANSSGAFIFPEDLVLSQKVALRQ